MSEYKLRKSHETHLGMDWHICTLDAEGFELKTCLGEMMRKQRQRRLEIFDN